MKMPITIEYNSGEAATYIAAPPEWVKWEKFSGNIISDAKGKIGITDLLFLAYHAMKRESAGKPVKPFEVWTETVANVQVEEIESPKVIPSEA